MSPIPQAPVSQQPHARWTGWAAILVAGWAGCVSPDVPVVSGTAAADAADALAGTEAGRQQGRSGGHDAKSTGPGRSPDGEGAGPDAGEGLLSDGATALPVADGQGGEPGGQGGQGGQDAGGHPQPTADAGAWSPDGGPATGAESDGAGAIELEEDIAPPAPDFSGAGQNASDLPVPLSVVKNCVSCSLACSDDDACTFDALTVSGICIHILYAPQCKQSKACGAQTLCDGDLCVGRAEDCSDGDPCTADSCDAASGTCAHTEIPGCAGKPCKVHAHCPAKHFCTPMDRCAPRAPGSDAIAPVRPKPTGTLRVLTWNTLHGFRPEEPGYNPDRKQLALQWLKATQPDVVGLQELLGWPAEDLSTFAAGYGHKYSAISSVAPKLNYRVGCTANAPIEEVESLHGIFSIGGIRCKIGGVHYFVVHLNWSDLTKRKQEALEIGKRVSKLLSQGQQVMVMGDMNSVGPYEMSAYALETPHTWFGKYWPMGQPPGNIDTTVLVTLGMFGLVDLQGKHQSGPLVSRTYWRGNAPWGLRIDYLLATKSLAAKSTQAWVADAPQRLMWSDHLPVLVDFKL